MGATAPPRGTAAFAADAEAGLVRSAAAGDGSAFATLYRRYESRAYNLAYRITGSEPDAADATQEAFLRAMRRLPTLEDPESAFGLCLFAATLNACHGLMEERRSTQPGDARPEAQLRREEVRDASMRLSEHQREALALCELEGLSYEGVAAIMETSRNAVAQHIYRGRINLYEEMRGTVLATAATPSPECDRALPLIAARQDGQLEDGSDDDAWLTGHLTSCERCGRGVEVMRQAAAFYRAWAPPPAVPWLFEETMAKASALADADWGDEIAEATAPRTGTRLSRRRRAIVAAGLAALLAGVGIAAALAGTGPSSIPDRPTAVAHLVGGVPAPTPRKREKRRGLPKHPRTKPVSQPPLTVAASPLEQVAASTPPPSPSASHQGASGVQPPQAISTPPKPKPKQTSTQNTSSQPVAAQVPPPTTQPPTASSTEGTLPEHPGKGRGPPGGVPPGGGKKN
ncbi:MAG TPA: sigma-70 family RNA polymerase sigma factor [Solirubrobacterales bacterium]